MQRSVEKRSSGKLSVDLNNVFSNKRFFINNLDSYHGLYILNQVSNLIKQKNAESATEYTESKHSQQALGEEDETQSPYPEQPYEIIGTVTDAQTPNLDHVTRIVSKSEILPQMLTCATVILDISGDNSDIKLAADYLNLLKDLLEMEAQVNGANEADVAKKRYLILISTVMTWAVTKPLDPDTPDLPFVETDFRKRKPHPNYKTHYDVENEVIGIARKYKSQIRATVVASGVTYGGKEDVLFYWFQKAWECERVLPIISRGGNAIPLINVQDLAQIIYNLLDNFPKKLYILAVEQNVTKQREIIKSLGKIVGSGIFKNISMEEAFLISEINQRIYDLLTLNLNMEPTFIVETMGLQWTSELRFSENVPALMKQFKKERGLKPFKILIYGPPIVGKTTLAKRICEAYGLVYISLETVVQDTIDDLTFRIKQWSNKDIKSKEEIKQTASESDDEYDDEDSAKETARQTLALLESGRPLSNEEMLGFLRQKLLNNESLNKGWVLDGVPINLAQCSALFDKGDEHDSITSEEKQGEQFDEDAELYSNVLKKILPDIVVSLEATDTFICEKAMRQSVDDNRFEEDVILKRLNDFRTGDTPELTLLNFFDELEIHPIIITVKDHEDYQMMSAYSDVRLRMGSPCSYKKLTDSKEEAVKKEKAELEVKRFKEAKRLAELEKKSKEEREQNMEYWSEVYSLMQEEEEAALAAAAEPMRNYLMHYIFPSLTAGLLEVAQVRPKDPVDYLAEYLFKLNPSGKMLEPGYNLQAEKLMGKMKLLDDALENLDIKTEPLYPDVDFGEPSSPRKSLNNMFSL